MIFMQPFSKTHYSARILERSDISDDLWIIRVDPGGEFTYVPGQYATLGVVSPAGHYERPYSIVSSPDEKFLEFFIELVPHGEVTPRLHTCGVGDEITLRKTAKGIFASIFPVVHQPSSTRHGHRSFTVRESYSFFLSALETRGIFWRA